MKFLFSSCSILVLILAQASRAAEVEKPKPLIVLDATTKQALSRSSATVTELPDGRTQVKLNGGHRHVMMSRLGKDGTIETFCASTEEQAKRFLSGVELDEKAR